MCEVVCGDCGGMNITPILDYPGRDDAEVVAWFCRDCLRMWYHYGVTRTQETGEWVDKMPTFREWEAEQTQCGPGRVKSRSFRFWVRVDTVRRWLGKRLVLWGCALAGLDTEGWSFLEVF